MKIRNIVLALSLVLFASPAMAKNFIKVGKAKFKKFPVAPTISTQSGNDFVVAATATKGTGVATLTIIFNDLLNQIAEGAEFDVTTGQNSVDGKAFANFTTSKSSRKGSTAIASDEESSVISGSLKIKKVQENGNFTGLLKMKISNALVQKQKFNIGSIGTVVEPKESRKKSITVTAEFTTEDLQ